MQVSQTKSSNVKTFRTEKEQDDHALQWLYNAVSKLMQEESSNENVSFDSIIKQLKEYKLVTPLKQDDTCLFDYFNKKSNEKECSFSYDDCPYDSGQSQNEEKNDDNDDLKKKNTDSPLKKISMSSKKMESSKDFQSRAPVTKNLQNFTHAGFTTLTEQEENCNHKPCPSRVSCYNLSESIGNLYNNDSTCKKKYALPTSSQDDIQHNKEADITRIRGSRVTASRDNWVVDPETGANLNYNNRSVVKSLHGDSNVDLTQNETIEDNSVLSTMVSWNQQVEEISDSYAAQKYAFNQHFASNNFIQSRGTNNFKETCNLNSKQLLLRKFLENKAEKKGQSQWSSPLSLALSSCVDVDSVDAIQIIATVTMLRDVFIYDYGEVPSLCIFENTKPHPLGEGSTEPIFDVSRAPILPPCDASYRMEKGVFQVYWNPKQESTNPTHFPEELGGGPIPYFEGKPLLSWRRPIPSLTCFLRLLKYIMEATQNPGCKTFAFRRLVYLRSCYNMHQMFNGASELLEVKENTHRDFYNVRKVDTHVHHSACMHQKHLLRFIRKKYRTEPDQIVARAEDGSPLTLRYIFDSVVGVNAWEASVDLLNVHALGTCFHRFDKFNSKYNPFGQALLREVFLKTDNMIKGCYLAEITKEVVTDLEDGKYQFVEWRVSIYGKSYDEWSKLSRWIVDNNLTSKQIRWMIQVPRLFHVYRKLQLISSFADLLSNIFKPLFEVVKDPDRHPEIYRVLLQMNGWDSVDDESTVSKFTSEGATLPLPEEWCEPTNPPYSYWAYYIYANIQSLNQLLYARGLRPLPFRPHCGEAGSISHLASMFLLADKINHGIILRKSPLLQYLYYLRQIGLSVSPLSNNALFHSIMKNPFYDYFTIGMNVALSSDDPLMFHFTEEALLEEYSCCAHVWRLSPVDLCEIARNSVLQSYFEPRLKKHWVGENYTKCGSLGNDITRTNVSNIRLTFRHDTLMSEWKYLRNVLYIDKLCDHILSKSGTTFKNFVS